jgi:soluble lytic murein transglycosylase
LGYARLQLAENKLGVDKAIAKVPDNLQKDARLIYERVRWRRRKDRDNAAVLFLNSYEGDIPNDLRGKWWHERHILARRFLERKDYIKAYKIAARHNQKEGFPLAQAEWLSGWLALNYLDKPAKAFKHFETLFNNVSTPISKARGAYWAGLASDENNYNKIAQQWYKVAAQYYGTFYGQLAAARLPSGEAPFKRAVKKPFNPPLTSQERKTFYNQNFVRIAKLLVQSGMSEHAQDFMYHIANKLDDKKDYALYIQLARQAEDWASLLRVGKKAMVKYLPIWEATYPIGPFPIGVRPHPSLTYGVIRQESAFYIDAQSGAGARGLMQLMPATAKGVAKRHGQRYSFARLTRDPAYNIYLGQAYLQEMLDRFDQATPLAVAAYNAGPNRVESWLKTYGDPRKKEIDWIDWMESIPVYETRNYVQRVLEAQHIYGIRMAP